MINTNITTNDSQGISFGSHYPKKKFVEVSPEIGYGLDTMVGWAYMQTFLIFDK